MYKKSDPPRDLNFLQILRDIAERKMLKGKIPEMKPGDPRDDGNEENEDLIKNRFDVIPAKAISGDEGGGSSSLSATQSSGDTGGGKDSSSSKRVTSENYRQLYLEQRAQEAAAMAQQKKDLEKFKTPNGKDPVIEAREKAAKAAMQKKVEDNFRFRVRELQGQIAWWNAQMGSGQYEQSVIIGTVQELQKELAGIPRAYW